MLISLNRNSYLRSLLFRSFFNVRTARRFRITAVFLKDTLDAAANDAEHLMTERLFKKAPD